MRRERCRKESTNKEGDSEKESGRWREIARALAVIKIVPMGAMTTTYLMVDYFLAIASMIAIIATMATICVHGNTRGEAE